MDMEMVFVAGFRERERVRVGSRGGAQGGTHINRAVWAQGTHEIVHRERRERWASKEGGAAARRTCMW